MNPMIKETNADSWEIDVLEAGRPVVVDFWHEQCTWCRKLEPVYEELSGEYKKADFIKLNILASDEDMGIARRYGIMGTPTMKVFCDGRVVGEIVGHMRKDAILKELDSIIKRSSTCLKQSTPLKNSKSDSDLRYIG